MNRTKTLCPCCGKLLFTLGALAESAGAVADGPDIEHDRGGHFMCCRHCGKRVVFESVAGGPSGPSFRLADIQLCVLCQ